MVRQGLPGQAAASNHAAERAREEERIFATPLPSPEGSQRLCPRLNGIEKPGGIMEMRVAVTQPRGARSPELAGRATGDFGHSVTGSRLSPSIHVLPAEFKGRSAHP